MKITLWGTRGSLGCSGPDTHRYGGNTSCVEIRDEDHVIILDAGTGIRRLGMELQKQIKRVDILFTHLHLDHLQGLGFFEPLYDPNMEVHLYGPAQSPRHFRHLLTRYLSPPLFPVLLSDLPSHIHYHKIPNGSFSIGRLKIWGQLVCHPGLTFGYRVSSKTHTLAYIPDHEPALGVQDFPSDSDWTSGYQVAKDVDLLLHDSQYSLEEYQSHVGWGHSAIDHALQLAELAKVKRFVTFHHDPAHNDDRLDELLLEATEGKQYPFLIDPGREDSVFEL